MAILLLRLPKVVLGFFLTARPCRGVLGACRTSGVLCPNAVVPALAQAHAHPVLDQSLCCTPSSGTILPTLETGKCSPRAHLHPRATQDRSSCFGRFPCPPLPPRHLISSLVMFQSPGETGRSPESQPQKWQTAAPPWPRLLPSATLQRRAAFSLSLRLPPAERLAFRRRMEKRRGAATSCLLWELTLRASHRMCPGQDATGGWDRALGTQRQQWGPVLHLTGCRFFLGVPIQQLPPLLLQNFPLPSDCVCGGVGETGREGRVARR